jgi:hypothetical protein
MCLVLHEVAESRVDPSQRDVRCLNMENEDDLHLTIIYYGLVDEINVLRVIPQAKEILLISNLNVSIVDIILHHD